MLDNTDSLSPTYRYFTRDLLTGDPLGEFPFTGVSFGRALKAAGPFTGSLANLEELAPMDFYNHTTPGNTALYVVRDGKSVWGGIIWSREYDTDSKEIQISASEFPSYFHHRRIWKTWGHDYQATITVPSSASLGLPTVVLDYGSSTATSPGSTVHIDFYDELDYRYSGYYKIASDPAPTTSRFSLTSAASQADITTTSANGVNATVNTKGAHGFSVGDTVSISASDSVYNKIAVIKTVGGQFRDKFTYSLPGVVRAEAKSSGSVSRSVPPGTYLNATVSVRADTYDFVRSLINSVSDDFMGIDFPNAYIEPGTRTAIDISSKTKREGYAWIETVDPHGLSVGQAVEVSNLGKTYDGEHYVTAVPDDYEFLYESGGTQARTPVTSEEVTIWGVSSSNGVATLNTNENISLSVGDMVEISAGGFTGPASLVAGRRRVTKVSSTKSFSVDFSDGEDFLQQYSAEFKIYASVATNLVADTKFLYANFWSAVRGTYTPVNGSAKAKFVSNAASGGLSATKAVTPGANVYLSIEASATSAPFRASLTLGSTTVYGPTISNPGEVSYISTTVPAGVTSASFGAYLDPGAPVGSVFYPTKALLGLNLSAADREFFDGSTQSGSNDMQYVWFGSAGNISRTSVKQQIVGVESVSGNGVSYEYTLRESSSVPVGAEVYVYGSVPPIGIDTISYDAVAKVATITVDSTSPYAPYNYSYLSPSIYGAKSVFEVTTKKMSGKSVTLTTRYSHNVRKGDVISLTGFYDRGEIISWGTSGGVTTFNLNTGQFTTGDSLTVSALLSTHTIKSKSITDGVASVWTDVSTGYAVNDIIQISGIVDKIQATSKSIDGDRVILTLSSPHNFLVDDEIEVTGMGAPYNGKHKVIDFTKTRVIYAIDSASSIAPTLTTGYVSGGSAVFNGEYTISAVSGDRIDFFRKGENMPKVVVGAGASIRGSSPISGKYTVTSAPGKSITIATPGAPNRPVGEPTLMEGENEDEVEVPNVFRVSVLTGSYFVTSSTRTTVTFSTNGTNSTSTDPYSGSMFVDTDYNIYGKTLTRTSDYTYTFPWTGDNNLLESTAGGGATLSLLSWGYDSNVSSVDGNGRVLVIKDPNAPASVMTFPEIPIPKQGSVKKSSSAIISSFGPFPGNANIGIEIAAKGFSDLSAQPTPYRGFELVLVGEALESYADTIDGFEYRVDTYYDEESDRFRNTFILLPINFPDAPAPGEVSPTSRFGADRLVFEYPGNIEKVSISESAENSATRFFAVGENDLGPDAGPPYSVASATDLLTGASGRRWPLLDAVEQIPNVDDENLLYSHAQRYLSESAPPEVDIKVTVNSSLLPLVGSYAPGDWCSLIIRDPYIQQRLAGGLEPRPDLLVRKIDSYTVNIPDNNALPEMVDLSLVAEWEVDKRGNKQKTG